MNDSAGWCGRILFVDLATGEIQTQSLPEDILPFIGGRGFAAWFYWKHVSPDSDALAPDNRLLLMAGPLAGTSAIACSRLVVSGKSPLLYPQQFGHATAGGQFASRLKNAGFDGIVITGKSPSPSLLSITRHGAQILPAADLWGQDTRTTLEFTRTHFGPDAEALVIGQAGENRVRFALLMGHNGSCAGHGFGAVMGSKNLKAVVISDVAGAVRVARPDILNNINREIRSLVRGRQLMDPMVPGMELVRRAPCKGCPAGCARGLYRGATGAIEHRKNCASAYFYSDYDKTYHGGTGTGMSFNATSLADRFGMCTQELTKILWWLNECRGRGIITESQTGLPLSRLGSQDFLNLFMHDIVLRRNIGDILADGALRAARAIGGECIQVLETILTGSGFSARLYNPRFFLTNAIFHATDRINPMAQLHEICYPLFKWVLWYATDGAMSQVSTATIRKAACLFWGDENAADFHTYDGKGRVACRIQNRAYAKETLVACDFFYPVITAEGSPEHVGDPTLESRLLSAVTGIDHTEHEFLSAGERIFNLTRIIQIREGHRGRADDRLPEFNFTDPLEKDDSNYFELFNPDFLLPGHDGIPVSRKGAVLDRHKFEAMLDEYYRARGWDVNTGLPTAETLKRLGLGFLMPGLCTSPEVEG